MSELTYTAVTDTGCIIQGELDAEGRRSKEVQFDPTSPSAMMALSMVGFSKLDPMAVSAWAVNTDNWRDVMRNIAMMCGLEFSFAEDGTGIFGPAPDAPCLMTRDLAFKLSKMVTCDHWYTYTITVKRDPQGLVIGPESFVHQGAPQ